MFVFIFPIILRCHQGPPVSPLTEHTPNISQKDFEYVFCSSGTPALTQTSLWLIHNQGCKSNNMQRTQHWGTFPTIPFSKYVWDAVTALLFLSCQNTRQEHFIKSPNTVVFLLFQLFLWSCCSSTLSQAPATAPYLILLRGTIDNTLVTRCARSSHAIALASRSHQALIMFTSCLRFSLSSHFKNSIGISSGPVALSLFTYLNR